MWLIATILNSEDLVYISGNGLLRLSIMCIFNFTRCCQMFSKMVVSVPPKKWKKSNLNIQQETKR